MKNEFARLLVRPPTLRLLKIMAARRGIPLVEQAEEAIQFYLEAQKCEKPNASTSPTTKR